MFVLKLDVKLLPIHEDLLQLFVFSNQRVHLAEQF